MKKQVKLMIKLLNELVEQKTNSKIFTLTKKYTKAKILLYFSFYNWRETARAKARTDEVLKELGIM